MTLQEFMPVMPIVVMGFLVSVSGFVLVFFERRAARKEREKSQNHTSAAASH